MQTNRQSLHGREYYLESNVYIFDSNAFSTSVSTSDTAYRSVPSPTISTIPMGKTILQKNDKFSEMGEHLRINLTLPLFEENKKVL